MAPSPGSGCAPSAPGVTAPTPKSNSLFPGSKGNSVKRRQFLQVIIPGTHTSHGSDKSTTKSFLKKGGGRRGSCLLETKIGQKVRTLQAGSASCDPQGHGVRPCRADTGLFPADTGAGACLSSYSRSQTPHGCQTRARVRGLWSLESPVLCRRPRGPGSEAQWAPPSSLKNQVGCLRGRTDPCAFSCHRAGAGRRLPPEDSTAPLPAPMETSVVHHETWVFAFGQSWGTVATRKV